VPSSMRVRGIGRRSAMPPYRTLAATLPAAADTWCRDGITEGTRGRRDATSRTYPPDIRAGSSSQDRCRHRCQRVGLGLMKMTHLVGAAAAAAGVIAVRDLTQKRHALQRNFPVIAHARYWLE